MKRKSLKTKLLSLLLAVAMVVTSITVWPTNEKEAQAADDTTSESTDTGYLELSFDSFGYDDGEYTGGVDKTVSWLKAFDKVAFTGQVLFPVDGADNSGTIRLASPTNSVWEGLNIFRSGGAIWIYNSIPNTSIDGGLVAAIGPGDVGLDNFDTEYVQIHITFDYVGEDVQIQVTFTANGQTLVRDAKTLVGGVAALNRDTGAGMTVQPNGSMSIKSVDRVYRELSFADFGIADQTVNNDTTITSIIDPTYAGVLDGVAITGYVTFPKYHNAYVSVGAIKWHANDLGDNATAVYGFTDWSEYPYVYGIGDGDLEDGIFNREVKMRITFDFNGEDLITTCTYDGIEKTQTYTGYAGSLGNTISARSQDGYYITLQSESEYIELTYSDFGITDTVKSGNTTVVENMDGVAVTGYVTFAEGDSMRIIIGSAEDYVNGARIMYASEVLWAGAELASATNSNVNWCSIGNASVSEMGFSSLPELMELRVMFDYLDYDADGAEDDVRVTVKYSECCIRTSVFKDATDKFGTYMSVPDAYTVKSVEKTFTEYSFENFGYDNPTILNADNTSKNSTTSPVDSWDGVRFTGTLTFGQSVTDNFDIAGVRIGSKDGSTGGIFVGVVNDVFWIWNATGATDMSGSGIGAISGAAVSELDATQWAGTEIPFSLTFEYFGNNVRLTTCIDNKQSNKEAVVVMKNGAELLGTNILAYANNDTTLKIGAGVVEEPEKCVDTGYLELSFDSFGYDDNTYTGGADKDITWLNTMDKVAFTGDILFPADGADNSGCVRIASSIESNWDGINIFRSGGNIWVYSSISNTSVVGDSCLAAIGPGDVELDSFDNEYVRVRVTFDYVGTDVQVQVTFTANGQTLQRDIRTITGGATELTDNRATGMGMTVQPNGSISIKSVDRAYRELTFGDFGIHEQKVTSGTVTSTFDPTYANVLDGVKFVGHVSFANYNNSYVSLGSIKWMANGTNTANAVTTGGTGFSDQCYVTTDEISDLFNSPTEMTVAFDMKGEDLYLTCTYNGISKTGTITGYAAKLGKTVTVGIDNENYPITVQSIDSQLVQTTFDDFGIGDQKVTGTTVKSTVTPITSLEKVSIGGKVTLPANEGSYVRFGIIPEVEAGVSVRYAGGALAMELASWGKDIYGPGYILIGANEIGLASDTIAEEPLNIKMTFETIRENTVLVSLTVEDKVTKSILVDTTDASVGCGMLVTAAAEQSVIIGDYVDKVYNEYTFRDFGLYDQDVTGTTVYSSIEPISDWNNVAVSGTLTFSENAKTDGSADYIRLGIASTTNWAGIQIRLAGENVLAMENVLWGSNEGNSYILVDAGKSLLGTEVPIRVVFEEQTDGTMLVGLSIDGGVTTTYLPAITLTESNVGFKMLVYTATDHTITIGSTEETINKSDVAYDIEEDPYFLMSTGTVSVNGESKNAGDTINKAGDYTIITDQSGIMVQQKVSLYIVGDVNLSSSTNNITLTEDDITALKAILAGEATATPAQKKAADLTNDGVVDNTDLKYLQDIVDGTVTRADIMDKYYPTALTYDYLGGNEVMPIVGYRGPSATYLNETTFDLIDKAGINMFNYLPNENMEDPASVLKELELAEKYGLGVYVTDANINHMTRDESDIDIVTGVDTATGTELANLLSRYSYFDSYLGNYIWDEPTLPNQDSDEIEETSERNIAWHEDIATELNGYANTSGYINIAAGYWFVSSGLTGLFEKDLTADNIVEYENIVKYITENTNAKMISFDRYLRDVDEVSDCERYFLNLDIIRNQAIASDLPFWAYAPLGGGWNNGGKVPTTAEFYWQVNMGLAFGAKGMQYYAVTPTGDESNLGAGLLNADGTANTTWYTPVQNINAQIDAVDEILMKSENIGIITSGGYAKNNTTDISVQTGSTSATTTNYQLDATIDYADIKSSDGVQRVADDGIKTTGTTYGVLTGVFNYQGKVALYIVNYDTTAARDITVEFTKASNYRVITANEDAMYLGESCTRNVGAGEAFLIVIEEEDLATTTQEFANLDDIAKFKNAEGTYVAPKVEGYVFAGWYSEKEVAGSDYTDYYVANANGKMPGTASDDEKNAVITDLSSHSGKLWAKYVDESVLTVKGQLASGTTATQTSTTKMRLVATTNSLIYSDIGFKIATAKNPTGVDVPSTTVYSKIVATDSNLSFEYAPDVFDSHSKYFATLTLINLPVIGSDGTDYTGTEYTITPFWTTPDGTRVYGQTRTLSVALGLAATAGSTYSVR